MHQAVRAAPPLVTRDPRYSLRVGLQGARSSDLASTNTSQVLVGPHDSPAYVRSVVKVTAASAVELVHAARARADVNIFQELGVRFGNARCMCRMLQFSLLAVLDTLYDTPGGNASSVSEAIEWAEPPVKSGTWSRKSQTHRHRNVVTRLLQPGDFALRSPRLVTVFP